MPWLSRSNCSVAAKDLEAQWRGEQVHWWLSEKTEWGEERSAIAKRFDGVFSMIQLHTLTEVYNRRREVTAYLPITKRRNTCQSPIATFHPSGAAQLPRSRYHYGCASR
jgi:hypothetical protein